MRVASEETKETVPTDSNIQSLKILIILEHKFCVEGTNGKHVRSWS